MQRNLAPMEVHESDGAAKKFFKKARNLALKGVNHDIHDEIADSRELTAVGALALSASMSCLIVISRWLDVCFLAGWHGCLCRAGNN